MGQLDDGWYYVQGGRYTTKTFFTGLCELDGTWYYLENGVLDRSKNGVVPFNDEWWNITNGVWNNKASGLAEYENIWYYVKDGKIDRSFTGEITLEDTTYSIVDGVWQH